MDHGTREVEKDPAELRDDMRNTRASITEKLETLECRVVETAEDIQHRVEATADKVKGSVHEAVQTVKDTVDWRRHVNEHPWAMVGGAVMAGFVMSRFVSSDRARSITRGVERLSNPYAAEYQSLPSPPESEPAVSQRGGTLLEKAAGRLSLERGKLEHAAVSAASDFVERLIIHAVPGLARYLR
jgi:ElaB/YqjD/DUF883 family membrane-anchored ribosome-binding protein